MEFETYVELHEAALKSLPKKALDEFAAGLDLLRQRNSTLWVAGNGGSAATASHTVADFVKTLTGQGSQTLRTIALSEMVSLQTAFANDVSFEQGMALSLELAAKEGDALLVISVSGLSPNLVAAVEMARVIGLEIFVLVGERGVNMASRSNFAIVVPSDDYQVVENIHLMIIHWLVKKLG